MKKIAGIAFSPITQYFFVFRSNVCLDADKVRKNEMRKGNFDFFFCPSCFTNSDFVNSLVHQILATFAFVECEHSIIAFTALQII